MLPGWGWSLVDDGRCRLWTPGNPPKIGVDWQHADTPARAWLIAILKALIATEDK